MINIFIPRVASGCIGILLSLFATSAIAGLNIGSNVIWHDAADGAMIEILGPHPDLDIPALIFNITDASETKPYLIKLGAGIYVLESDILSMKEWVSIQGAGQEVTKLTRTGRHAVLGADNVALTDLTVEITGDADAVAILNQHVSPRIENVHAIASAADGARGVYNQDNHATMINVTASASGGGSSNYGVRNVSSAHTTMNNVTASASGGTRNYGVAIHSSSSTIMANVTASASGGSYSHGVHISGSSPTMTNVTARASGGTTYSYGIEISDDSSPFIKDSTLEGSTSGLYISYYSSIGTHVVNNKIIGGVTDPNTAISHCRGNYDENLDDVDC